MGNDKERTVAMKVLVLSPPRTGTTSMHQALTALLGAPIYHGALLMERHERTAGKFWLNCIQAKYEGKGRQYTRKDFDHGLGEFAGVADIPCCFLWRELMDAYPEAKVILVERDVESWATSFLPLAVTGGAFTFVANVIIAMEPFMGTYTATMVQKQLLGYFKASEPKEIERNARDIFRQHYQDIRAACASTPGRLLDMKIEQGWTPLCKFLDLPVPSGPFPRTNEFAIMKAKAAERTRKRLQGGVLLILTYLAILLIAGAISWRYFTISRSKIVGFFKITGSLFQQRTKVNLT